MSLGMGLLATISPGVLLFVSLAETCGPCGDGPGIQRHARMAPSLVTDGKAAGRNDPRSWVIGCQRGRDMRLCQLSGIFSWRPYSANRASWCGLGPYRMWVSDMGVRRGPCRDGRCTWRHAEIRFGRSSAAIETLGCSDWKPRALNIRSSPLLADSGVKQYRGRSARYELRWLSI
jgi:hypothetical protein